VSKGSRNRQQAREKITKMRALEARRRRRRSWVAGIGAAVVVIAVAMGITLAVAGSSGGANLGTGGTPQLKLSSLASLGPSGRPALPGGRDPKASQSPALCCWPAPPPLPSVRTSTGSAASPVSRPSSTSTPT
jgi:hypothetical protein